MSGDEKMGAPAAAPPPIRVLPNQVIDQIKAGEVVERPGSVVKELVENALDAGATQIDLVLKEGGRALLRVSDNGHGMRRQDALLAIERHATSKIRAFEDLQGVRTLGFRGEALPSIAAVSRFELVTRCAEEEAGTRIRIEAGVLKDVQEQGAPVGTMVEVRDLFRTLPPRRAFLRTASTELAHCTESVVREALVRPGVGFELSNDDRVVLRAPKTNDPVERARDLLGADAEELRPIQVESLSGMRLVGLAAPPGVHRATASTALYLYVNGRWVRDQVMRRAVGEVYRGLVPEGRHPVVVLDLQLPGGAVDVNVHPTKAEVRFRDPAGVAAFVADALREALGNMRPRHGAPREGAGTPLPFRPPAPPPETPSISALPEGVPIPPIVAQPPPPGYTAPPSYTGLTPEKLGRLGSEKPGSPAPAAPLPYAQDRAQGLGAQAPSGLSGQPSTPPLAGEAARLDLVSALTRAWLVGVVGVVRQRWLVIDDGQAVWVVDGGRLARMASARAAQGSPQRLLVPKRVPVTPREAELVESADLSSLGLLVGRFSPNELAVRAVPPSLSAIDPEELLRVALRALVERKDVREAWGRELPPVVPITAEALAGADWREAKIGQLPLG